MFRPNTEAIRAQGDSQPDLSIIGCDPIENVSQHSSIQELSQLALTNRFFFNSTQHSLNLRKLAVLTHYVVLEPNESIVTTILNSEPALAYAVVKQVKDHAGRLHTDKTIFQLAYGAGDYHMCLAMKPSFVSAYGSEEAGIQGMKWERIELLAGESREQSLRKEQDSKTRLKILLQAVIAAINAETFANGKNADNKWILSPATLAAIVTFREKFSKNQLSQPQINGMHFRYNTLSETYNAYAVAERQWNRDYKKCALFEDGVLAHVLLYVPANDAQKFSQGLNYLDSGQPFSRQLTLRGTNNNFYSSLQSPSLDFDLVGSYVNIMVALMRSKNLMRQSPFPGPRLVAKSYSNLCQTKILNLQNVCSQLSRNRSLSI